MKKNHLVKLISLFVLFTILVSACSSGGTSPSATALPSETAAIAPSSTPSPTPSPTPTPPFMVRADAQAQSADPTTFVAAETGDFNTLDPAVAYDTNSSEVIQNIYETLVFYDAEKTDVFVPMLAESWDISPDGRTYTFHIRQGVTFHNGNDLTPSDVAYSFQRGLLQGGSGSPQLLLTVPFLGIGINDISQLIDPSGELTDNHLGLSHADPASLMDACQKVKYAIVADDEAGTVTMTLAQPNNSFFAIIAQPWGGVMDWEWAVDNGGWDGSCDTWQDFYAPRTASNPFTEIANGTGPFQLDHWTIGSEVVLTRNENYWREPAQLERVIILLDGTSSSNIALMESGQADTAEIALADRNIMDLLVGERCEYDSTTNIYKPCQVIDDGQPLVLFSGRPRLAQDVLLFNYDIGRGDGSSYIGSAALDGAGIPTDFFTDVHIRKAFAYCFDWDALISDVYNGNALQSFQLPMAGMPGFMPDAPHYSKDLEKCAEEFKLADVDKDGIAADSDPDDVWNVGFQFEAVYNRDNVVRQLISETLAINLAAVNDKFVVSATGASSDTYFGALITGQLPLMTAAWLEDIHDPDNWFTPYTVGLFVFPQSLPDEIQQQFQDLLSQGLQEQDPLKRDAIYRQATQLYYDQAVGLPLVLALTHNYYQRWVQGLVLNPLFPGMYFYPIHKQ